MALLALVSAPDVAKILVLVLGFGFVIFFHELGHFLAAKWVGIKVEQFAVGFGQALFSWRKGIGVRLGNTQKEYHARIEKYVGEKHNGESDPADKSSDAYQRAAMEAEKALGLGETEYRLNWIPLGGYVKMLGQDDLRPNSEQADPRSYNRKSIPARMLVVSAGVIMNVILAGIGFMVLFMVGFNVPPAWVGSIMAQSPAQLATTPEGKHAPLQVGDKVITFDGRPQEDFTKIGLWVALSREDTSVPITVQHPDNTIEQLRITPKVDDNSGFLSIGIAAPKLLEGVDAKDMPPRESNWQQLYPADQFDVGPGEVITAINGQAVKSIDYWKLDQAAQASDGTPIALTVFNKTTGKSEVRQAQLHFDAVFSGQPMNFAGMMPLPAIGSVVKESDAVGKALPGDVVTAISFGKDAIQHPTAEQLREQLSKAGSDGRSVNLTVSRAGKTVQVSGLTPNLKIDDKGKRGLGIGLEYADSDLLISDVIKGSPADAAHLKGGDRLVAIDGKPLTNWFDVQLLLKSVKPNEPVKIAYSNDDGSHETTLALNSDQIFQVACLRRSTDVQAMLKDCDSPPRQASGPVQAAYWGVTETRDFILQFYLTLRRMAGGSVSPKQLMGPVGIFVGGAKFAFRGWDWLLWFLAMISANLAVVNFLPIPIVDGGLFTFLILEKIQGRPLSPRAQAIAQYVGLAFLAGVFLFVTYHDIVRYTPWG
jgi:regulator of sigma E protease